MSLVNIPVDIEKIKNSQYLRFIDTTPSAQTPTWKVVGIGVTELSTEYNAQVDTEQWIIEDSARNDHTGNQKSSSVTQKCYKGDPEFEFVNEGRDKLNYTTHVLEIDIWDKDSNNKYSAKMSDGLITISTYSGGQIEYNLMFNGDPKEGKATIADGVPTFTESQSL